MKTFLLLVTLLLSSHRVGAQCVAEDTAMDTCMETAGLGEAGKQQCDLCITTAADGAISAGVTCEDLSAGDSLLCTALGICACPESCTAEAEAYALCEVNEELGNDCTTISCDAAPMSPTTAPDPADDECAEEDMAMDACMETAGIDETAQAACDLCIVAAADAAVAAVLSCDDLASGQSPLCSGLARCPTCPVGVCDAPAESYALCEINAQRSFSCETFFCDSATPTPTPTAPSPTSSASGSILMMWGSFITTTTAALVVLWN